HLESFDERFWVVVVAERGVGGRSGFHPTGPPRAAPPRGTAETRPAAPTGPARRTSVDGPARPDRSRATGRAGRGTVAGAGSDAPVAADAVDALGERGPEPGEIGGPTGDDLEAGQGGQQTRGHRRVAIERDVGDP